MFSGNKSLTEQTADIILDHIIEKNYAVGTKIPNEFELAKMFGVGRSTIREAVRLLASRNILVVKRGSGTYVADRTGIPEDPLGLSFEMDKYTLAWDLVNVRIILEPEIAAYAATNATDEEAQAIIAQCNKVEELYLADIDHLYEDIKFHEAIAKCSRNKVMEKLIPIINTSVAVFVNVTKKALKDETLTTHRAIANAIADHDPHSARYAMMMHLAYNRRKIAELRKMVNENEAD